MDIIKTENGYISGTMIGELGKEIRVYRGIPYAAPPVGDLRWKPPQPATSWEGIRECTAFSKIAPQSFSPPPGVFHLPTSHTDLHAGMIQSEDCLYLNVLTPAKDPDEKLPVMVFMHGGGLEMGHGNEVLYNMPRLPQHGIVLVNVNMRLGLIGLLAHPSLSKESPDGASGNYMFLDMIAALKWVQRNISAFGGDPDNVTIFGESGGGRKVTAMLASPLAKGLFHRCIVESGGECGSPLKDNETKGEKFFELLGCDKEPDPLSAARAQSLEKLMEAQKLFVKDLQRSGPAGPWDASVDGWFLPDTTANIFKAGKQNRVPFIVGANLGELKDHVGNQRILYYTDTLSGMKDVEWYAYIFDQVPAGWRKNNVTSAHAMELCYVFGDWDNSSGFWKIVMSIAGPNAIKSPDPGVTAVDKQVAEKMMSIWTQFAKTGNPGASGLTEWPTYDPDDEKYLYIAEELDVRSGFSKLAMK